MKNGCVFLLAIALTGCVHRYQSSDALGKGNELDAPAEFKNGTASLQQVKAWSSSSYSYLGGKSSLELLEEDLDQDGIKDLLVADQRWAGTGGNNYLAFQKTVNGYRYIGILFFGGLRVLPKDGSGQQKLLSMSCSGSGNCTVFLTILDAKGFHEIARAHIAAGDSGTEEGNRTSEELFGTNAVSSQILQKVFGKVF